MPNHKSAGLRSFAFIAILGLAPLACAQSEAPLPSNVTALVPLERPNSERYRFESARVGKAYVIDVTRIDTPSAAPVADELVPVVFVTDNQTFAASVPSLIRRLALPSSVYVVGIGWDDERVPPTRELMLERSIRRNTDFSPVNGATEVAAMKADWARVGFTVPEHVEFGGADAFLAFIEEELKSFVAARYPADMKDATLVGHSMGGLFALHVLFTAPAAFNRYVSISPPVNYANDVLFREEAASGDDLSARLFMAVAGNDIPYIMESVPRLNAQILARGRPELHYTYQSFPDDDHVSIALKAIESGLRTVFELP